MIIAEQCPATLLSVLSYEGFKPPLTVLLH